jgi:radical SAM protein (TIGR01212 family)
VVRERYEAALSHPAVRGLVIGTRPDCIDAEKLDYLSSMRESGKIVEVEYGIESVYDHTLRRINRGHDFACTRRAVMETASRGLTTGGHIIIGLPGETREMILQEAEILSGLPLDYLKFHQLQILKGTPMASEYKERPGDFLRPGPKEYIDLLAGIITRLRPDIAIARIASSVPPSFTDAPWGLLRHDELVRRLALRLEEMAP